MFFVSKKSYRSLTVYRNVGPVIQCFFIYLFFLLEQLSWEPCKKTSGCNLSRLLARHLLVCCLEAIRSLLNILSLSHLLLFPNIVAVIFPVCLNLSFSPHRFPSSFSHICHAECYLSIAFASSLTLCLVLSWVTFTPSPPRPPPPTLLCFMAKSCYSARLQPDSSL